MNQNWDVIWNDMADGMQSNPGRNIRHKALLNLIGYGKVLDFGSGDGQFVIKMIESGIDAVGWEQSKVGFDNATAAARQKGINGVFFNVKEIKEIKELFDFIIISEVLEHIKFPQLTLQEVSKSLKPDGKIIITVPAGPISKFDKFIGHHRHYTKKSIIGLIENSNLEVVGVTQIGFPIVNIVRIWCLIRGDKLIEDLRNRRSKNFNPVINLVLKILTPLSHINSPLGWQLIAVAKLK